MSIENITSADTANKGVLNLEDVPNLSAAEMKAKFDELARSVLIPKVNELIAEVNNLMTAFTGEGVVTAGDILNWNAKADIDLLWENASPTSDFAAQSVSVDTTGYRFLAIYFRGVAAAQRGQVQLFSAPGGDANVLIVGSTTSANFYNRRVIISGTAVEFGDGYTIKPGTTGATVSPSAAIPWYIYGIKGGN